MREKDIVFRITPLGAAYLEALPNQVLANAIQLVFDHCGICPASELFTLEEANAWACDAFKERRQAMSREDREQGHAN